MSEENGKVCCNCRHNIRKPKKTYVENYCEIDGHYIVYIECFEGWCRHWASDEKEWKGEE